MSVLIGSASAQKESVFYSFCKQSSCPGGENPYAGLIFDGEGNLYGTASQGGKNDGGTVFKVTPSGKETVLYRFCPGGYPCADGLLPYSGLVFDKKGNLYGTTNEGGTYGGGTVFKITPAHTESVLYSFCALGGFACTDGEAPWAGLVFDKKGNLYGTTSEGGTYSGGTVFKVTPAGKESVLYSFCAQGGTNCTDGGSPYAGLVFDKDGNLYGTTYSGGAYGKGTVFKVMPSGQETVLYSFCGQSNCTDGSSPFAGLIFDQQGNLYGTTKVGGANVGGCFGGDGCGSVFKVTSSGKESVIHSFDGGDDGGFPFASLVFDKKGNLYGTTSEGGTYAGGTVFKITPAHKESVLYSFCALGDGNCTDGESPYAGLVFDTKGNLYSTTVYGGAYGDGSVFKLVP